MMLLGRSFLFSISELVSSSFSLSILVQARIPFHDEMCAMRCFKLYSVLMMMEDE